METQEERTRMINKYKAKKKKDCIILLVFDLLCLIAGIALAIGSVVSAAAKSSSPEGNLVAIAMTFGVGFVLMLIFLIVNFVKYRAATVNGGEKIFEEARQYDKAKLRIQNAGKWGKKFKYCEEMETFQTTRDFGKYIKFDDKQEAWIIPTDIEKNKKHIHVYKFSDILGADFMMDGAESDECNLMKINISVDNAYTPVKTIDLFDGDDDDDDDVDKDDDDYKEKYALAQQIMGALKTIIRRNKAKEERDRATPHYSQFDANMGALLEFEKCRELLDKGIITQEEFEQKKRQLLGL